MKLPPHHNHIITSSKELISLLGPNPVQIHIEDIARGLAYKPHFNGQTPKFFSIAEHSILVYKLLPRGLRKVRQVALAALLHDASEAYIGDCPQPLKEILPEFVRFEDRLQNAINKRFNIDPHLIRLIKPLDNKAQVIEYQAFYDNVPHPEIKYLEPDDALYQYLSVYRHVMSLQTG